MPGTDASILVGVGGDVCDELLRCEREEAGQWERCFGWWWKPGEGEVVRCYCVWDLFSSIWLGILSCGWLEVAGLPAFAYNGCIVIHLPEKLA